MFGQSNTYLAAFRSEVRYENTIDAFFFVFSDAGMQSNHGI